VVPGGFSHADRCSLRGIVPRVLNRSVQRGRWQSDEQVRSDCEERQEGVGGHGPQFQSDGRTRGSLAAFKEGSPTFEWPSPVMDFDSAAQRSAGAPARADEGGRFECSGAVRRRETSATPRLHIKATGSTTSNPTLVSKCSPADESLYCSRPAGSPTCSGQNRSAVDGRSHQARHHVEMAEGSRPFYMAGRMARA